MTVCELEQRLFLAGFSDADQLADFGYTIPYVRYVLREVTPTHREYLTCVTYDNQVVETVVEVYKAKKSTRPAPKGVLQNLKSKKPEVVEKAQQDLLDGGFVPLECYLVREDEVLKGVLE